MPKYQTSKYLSVALNYDLSGDFRSLPEDEIVKVATFLSENGDAGFQKWLSEWSGQLDSYMGGKKSRIAVLKAHPELHAFFEYARWRRLQNGALVHTLLSRCGYAEACSPRGAYEPAAEFLDILEQELSLLAIWPPTHGDIPKETWTSEDFQPD